MNIYFIQGDKVTTWFGFYHQTIIRSQVHSRTWGSYTL